MTKETPYQMVERFHQVFKSTRIPEKPTAFTDQHAINRAAFKIEEIVEMVAATSEGDPDQLKQSVQYLHQALDQAEKKIVGKKQYGKNPLIEQVDALTDLLYFTYGSFSLLGVDPTSIFEIVHQANMGKLFPDGQPHYDAITKKILKPENWQTDYAPEGKIAKEIDRQTQVAKTRKKSVSKQK
ncbi:hypothetical protein A5844_002457 [Enterococcus sp. 10A9_DIV0425]|uniref:Cof family protein n=1 Tax=Candidatus Enterococcus wittei TaxID=1987383 RepID=A0A242JWH7_9ENTE|nr:HAD family hydrolase [Enterococcus sp. 10A9_DIV0425]OTP09677.1 hypothetical protein A5844_002457 [Enterococcus sp. 10A9_DIV0425]THE08580.1 HAD family hydrolase [Enterococcus hirae]